MGFFKRREERLLEMTQIHGTAEYYQDNKESDDWGDPVGPPIKPYKRPGAMISVRFSPEEVEIVRTMAARMKVSVSRYVRLSALSGVPEKSASPIEGLQRKSISGTYSTYVRTLTGSGSMTTVEDLNLRPVA
jgi:hypothetical protein